MTSLFVFLLLLPSMAWAQRVPSTTQICNSSPYVSPSGGDSLPSAGGNAAAIGTAGLVRCARVTMQCSITASNLYWRVGVGVASQTCAVGIYDKTGASQITASPESTTCASSSQNRSAAVSPFTLTAGTEYLACFASSGTTVQVFGNASGTANAGGTNNVVDGATAVANKAQFNIDCASASTPYSCCTGAGTGTCTGMPSSLGTLSAAGSSTFPYLQVQ